MIFDLIIDLNIIYSFMKFCKWGDGMVNKKEVIAMLLAGGQGSRLGILTRTKAKPAVSYGGKYRIIDFPMSNCINSGIDTVGVLTQYQPLALNRHIGIGIPWDMDKSNGGVTMLAPHEKASGVGDWYTGTANAIFQNISYIDEYNPDYVLILSGDHIYKMDYAKMLGYHKEHEANATIAVLEVPLDEAGRYGIMNAKEDDSIYEFEEKPQKPKSNLASMGIYVFNWPDLKKYLHMDHKLHDDSDFGKHIIPEMLEDGLKMMAYRFDDYWKDVGTVESYWQANMEMIKIVPDFNLYDDFWKIYTDDTSHQTPLYTGEKASIKTSLVSDGCEIYGKVENSIIGPEVKVCEGAYIKDSIIMKKTVIGKNSRLTRCIIDDECTIGENVKIGEGENVPNADKPQIYNTGITVIGTLSKIPSNVNIGKNCVIYGITFPEHYKDGKLESGKSIILEEEEEV